MWPQLLAAEGLPLEEAEARVQQLTADVHAVLGAQLATWASSAAQHSARLLFLQVCITGNAGERLGAECALAGPPAVCIS